MQIKPPFSHSEENFPTNIKTQSEINCWFVMKHYFVFPNISNIKIPGSFYLQPPQHSWNINFVSTQSVGERDWLEMLTENILPN